MMGDNYAYAVPPPEQKQARSFDRNRAMTTKTRYQRQVGGLKYMGAGSGSVPGPCGVEAVRGVAISGGLRNGDGNAILKKSRVARS